MVEAEWGEDQPSIFAAGTLPFNYFVVFNIKQHRNVCLFMRTFASDKTPNNLNVCWIWDIAQNMHIEFEEATIGSLVKNST